MDKISSVSWLHKIKKNHSFFKIFWKNFMMILPKSRISGYIQKFGTSRNYVQKPNQDFMGKLIFSG